MLVRGVVLTVVMLGLVAFSVLLAKVTLTPSPASEDLVTSNLRPGRSLRQYAEDYTFLAACKQAGGNLLLGVPFGLLLPFFVTRRLRMIRTTVLTAAVMVIVELIQGALVSGRAFDVDDVILNTSGALLGYFVLGRRISHRYYTYAEGPRRTADTEEPTPKAESEPKPKPKPASGLASRLKPTPRSRPKETTAARAKAGRTAQPKATPKASTTASAKATPKAGARAGGRTGTGSGGGRALLDRLRGR